MPRSLADLESRAYDVADAYRGGRLGHLARKDWADTWGNLVGELRSRCPGFSEAEYGNALEGGFRDSR